jgi:hypothetical protein
MCISNLKTSEKQIAEEDITVLKVVKRDSKNRLTSPIFSDVWYIGVEKEVDFKIIRDCFEYPPKDLYRTTTGLYSYNSSCDPKFCSITFGHLGKGIEVYEAVIQKGAEYIKKGSQFCSNKLKLIKRVL